MNFAQEIKPLDLNVAVPRSSRETMEGIAHLPRMIDKARSYRNSTLADYIYPCPLDRHVLNFLKTSPEEFADLATENDDAQMTEWTRDTAGSRSVNAKNILNEKILDRWVDPEDAPVFFQRRGLIDPARTDVITWDQLTDLEEGRI